MSQPSLEFVTGSAEKPRFGHGPRKATSATSCDLQIGYIPVLMVTHVTPPISNMHTRNDGPWNM